VAVGIGAGLGINGAMSADASPTLPAKSPATLLAGMDRSNVTAFSGTVVQHADLGLPDISGLGGGRGSSDLSSLVTGSHTMRVWYDSPQKIRLALLGTLGESDLIRNNNQLWSWSSQKNQVTRYTLPADKSGTAHKPAEPATPLTPQQAADKILASVNPTTKVTTEGTVSVAGRSAYQLVIAPRDTTSTIGQIKVAVDSKTYSPLRVQVYAKGASKAAIEVGFTQVSFGKPSGTEFQFTPPKGSTVKQGHIDGLSAPQGKHSDSAPTIVGKGWTSVLVVKESKPAKPSGQFGAVMGQLPRVSGSWGSGQLFSSSLVNALFTDDGRVIVGAVPANQLYAAAAHR
jgi:outer membrane lipoprotein-sorting protein